MERTRGLENISFFRSADVILHLNLLCFSLFAEISSYLCAMLLDLLTLIRHRITNAHQCEHDVGLVGRLLSDTRDHM